MARFWNKYTQYTQVATFPWVQNKRFTLHLWQYLGSLITWCLISHPLTAQVAPDGSLGTEVNTNDSVTEIIGGTELDSNLFHSFQEFSVETGSTVFFNNGVEIDNIIGRVTGNSISNLDGLIRANGDANLILINPNGITLGSNVRLDIGGSFLGSTAESVVFQDGTVFNTDLNTEPLLTISTPIGLQLGQDAAGIQVSGTADIDAGLALTAGNTFALVGNGITFDGGVVTAESGRIELGSVASGQVSITEIAAGWQLGYEGVTQFGELQLLERSALLNPNTSANSTGGIQVQGSNITLERSKITTQILDDASGGNIRVNATESLTLSGVAEVGENSSQISSNVVAGATGNGGTIEITTDSLNIEPRSFIDNSIFGSGSAGDIKITANEIDINGAGFLEFQQRYRIDALEGNLQPGSRLTGIFAGTATTGTAGNIEIATDSLNLTNGAIIFTPVFTAGNGGNINVTATDIQINASAIQNGGGINSLETASLGNINLTSDRLSASDGGTVINLTFGDVPGGNINVIADAIDFSNTPPDSIVGTGLLTNTSLGSGDGGDLSVEANTITLDDAIIASNSGAILPDGIISAGGLGGDINIQARESIEASGVIFNDTNPRLSVGAGVGTTTYTASDGGNLTINTSKLILNGGASLASATFGAGDGGQLTINATDTIELTGFTTERGMNRGGLFASSGNIMSSDAETTGASGDISITTPNLIVQDGAIIDVQGNNRGDAGSIEILSDSILLTNQATLSATTEDGAGGDIQINTNVLQLDQGLINASVLGVGTGGNIEINAQDSVKIIGSGFEQVEASLFDPDLLSPEFLASLQISQINQGILAASVDSGNAGIINIQTANLSATEGGLIATATGGIGMAGSILLNATELIVVDGSFVSNNTLFNGQGGDIDIDTSRLEVLQGGQITASTLGAGNGGSVEINASESVIVSGNAGAETLASNISVGAQSLSTTTGNGGDLIINTPNLNIDGGAISIGSTGSGEAGSLLVDAESIMVDNQGSISADTESGGGGNITLDANNIIWQGASFTTATAGGSGDGGNIIIEADNVVLLENSQINANAFMGMGGNVEISTEGLFVCQSCQVSASSELGVDGVVDIETLEPTPLNSLDISQRPTQAQEEVAVACPSEPGNSTSQLTITGRGGLPNRPQELLNARSLIKFDSTAQTTANPKKQTNLPAPARGWYRTSEGKVVLTAQVTKSYVNNSRINSVDCHG